MATTPGIHDPYWYESFVGLGYVVELFDPDSGVESVTFQSPDIEGADDVVVLFAADRKLGIQLKHTREAAVLTFSDLVSPDGKSPSLLRKLARGWRALGKDGSHASTRLFTNRAIATRRRKTGVHLGEFWEATSGAIRTAATLAEIRLPEHLATAWQRWLEELADLSDEQKLVFMQTFELRAGEAELQMLEDASIARLQVLFGVPAGTARQVYERLLGKLPVWTTTRREARISVTREDALEAIRVPLEEPVGDHDFPPPTPFFPSRQTFSKHLATLLTKPDGDPVLFLSGPAGCGKTSIVSDLANRVEPVVDLRFHAFRPISPETALIPQDYLRTATASALWGDLLIQLRTRYFLGRLSEAGVPARNDLLQDEPARLRAAVLRLAALLAKERGGPFVIAIDGLDHAARGRAIEPQQFLNRPALLEWLVPPDDVPAGVKLLVAGQPHPSYPPWLPAGRGVHAEQVPPIAQGDVEALLRQERGDLPEDQIERAAAIISEVCQGNTLSAVYAATEARTSSDVGVLRKRLEQRELHTGIDAYYRRIWKDALDAVRQGHPAIDTLLGSALTMSSARLTGDLLRGFFPTVTLTAVDWNRVLRQLAPIVEERSGGFAVLHNDVRIFLTGTLQDDTAGRRSAAGMIADFYRGAPPSPAKHRDLFRALSFAGRQAELPALFDPAFVIDGWDVGMSKAELTEQAQRAGDEVTRTTGWESLHTYALGLRTLQQLDAALQWLDEAGPAPALPSCLPSETRPVAKSGWTLHVVQQVLSDARRIADAGDARRGQALVRRWFGSATPAEVFAEVRRHPGALEPQEQRTLDEQIHTTAWRWGALAQHVGFPKRVLNKPRSERASKVMASFFGGWLNAGVDHPTRPWRATLSLPTVRFIHDIEKVVRALAKAERWEDVALTLREFAAKRDRFSERFQIRAAAWALMTGDPALVSTWAEPIDRDGTGAAAAIKYEVSEDFIELFAAIAFTTAWLNPTRPASAISEEGAEAFFAARQYERGHMTLRTLLYAVGTLARLERAAREGRDFRTVVRSDELGAIVTAFFTDTGDRGHEVTPYFFRRAPVLLARILSIVASQDAPAFDAAITPILANRVKEMRYDTFLPVLWRFAADHGHADLLRAWAVKWIGPNGEAWKGELSDRRDAVEAFRPLLLEAGLRDVLEDAERRYRRSQVGYTGRKEYALGAPLEWFEAAAGEDPAVWSDFGARLLSVSRVASQGGDNRLAIFVEAAVTSAAARSGPAALWRCLTGLAAGHTPALVLARTSATDALIALLENTTFPRADLLKLWAIGNGALVWQHDRHRLYLAHLRDSLLAVARSRNDTELPGLLAASAPRVCELDARESSYRFPSRWFQSETASPPPPHQRETAELIALLRSMSIRDALSHLEKVADTTFGEPMAVTSDLWRAMGDYAERLSADRPAAMRAYVQRLIAITRRRTEPYSWEFDGLERALAPLIPLLREDDLWELCAWIFDGLKSDRAQQFWIATAAHNLGALCAMRAFGGTPSQRRAGLEKELAAQEAWIRGAVTDATTPLISWPPPAADDPDTWGVFGVRGLVQMLGGVPGAHRLQASMRGLYMLLAGDHTLLPAFVAPALALDNERKYLALLLAERLVMEQPDVAGRDLKPLLDAAAVGDGRVHLQGLVVHAAAARLRGEQPTVKIRPADPHEHRAPKSRGVLHVGPEKYGSLGLLRHGPSSVRQAVRQLAAATDVDPDLLERHFADRLAEQNGLVSRQKASRDGLLDGELRCTSEPALHALATWAVAEAGAGCFGPVSALHIAQAVLEMDDPWLLTRAATSAPNMASWPYDKALVTLLAQGKAAASAALAALALDNVSDGERVAGVVLHTYSRASDVVLVGRARWARDVVDPSELGRGDTFNGRTFVYYVDDPFEPPADEDSGWFMLRSGGQGLVVHATVPLVPTSVWRDLGWTPSAGNPLVWESDGLPVARFEAFYGPVRDSVQDALYRQPCAFRWLVTNDAWRAAEAALGATLRLETQLEVHPSPLD